MPRPNHRTKIVCTLGPAVGTKAKIKALIVAGMNVARINCSHGDWTARRQWVEWIRELQPDVSPIGLLFDLQGPKVRIGEIEGGEIQLRTGARLPVANRRGALIQVTDATAWAAIKIGDRLLLGDGAVELRAISRRRGVLECRVVSGGTVRSRQGLTIVGRSFDVPPLTAKDKEDLNEALRVGADFVALSYVRSASDVNELRRLIDRRHKGVKTVAKIETREALEDIDRIARAADVVMVARGDLGLQMDLEEVPIAQKRIIAACNAAATPVITATQMLESMLHSPRPTRAEASDVANAILDGTDAVMLSGETAMGDYPIEAVKTMAAIARKTEPLIDRGRFLRTDARTAPQDAETDSVARAAVGIASALGARAILTSSTSGMTPRLVSRYRPPAPLLCLCWDARTQRQLSVVWGVESAVAKLEKDTDAAVRATVRAFASRRYVMAGDKVVVTAGVPAGVPGNTNMILVLNV